MKDPWKDPVSAADGHTYERANIERWIQSGPAPRSPMTNEPLAHTHLSPNIAIKVQISDYLAANPTAAHAAAEADDFTGFWASYTILLASKSASHAPGTTQLACRGALCAP
eukprot:5064578-Prymnesium_polylepis.1